MKKLARVVMVMVFGLCSISASSQYFGVRAGVGISNLLTTSGSYGSIFSTQIGGTLDFELADRFSLQTGLTFFKKGGGDSFNNYNLYYLETPITARYDFVEVGANGRFYARAGFYSGLLLAANVDGFGLDVGNKFGDDFKAIDFGLISGVGYGFNKNIDIGLMFEFGFIDIEPNQSLESLSNGTTMISANYRFGI